MKLGWKRLIPIALGWTLLVATLRVVSRETDLGQNRRTVMLVAALVFGAIYIIWTLIDIRRTRARPVDQRSAPSPGGRSSRAGADEFDAFAGGYPVPPMPGQAVPAGVTAGAAVRSHSGGERTAAGSTAMDSTATDSTATDSTATDPTATDSTATDPESSRG
jgi:NADH-quinone oxidoreductase subunit H